MLRVNSFVYIENNRFMKGGNELYFLGYFDTIGLLYSPLNKTKMIETDLMFKDVLLWENYEIQPNK